MTFILTPYSKGLIKTKPKKKITWLFKTEANQLITPVNTTFPVYNKFSDYETTKYSNIGAKHRCQMGTT